MPDVLSYNDYYPYGMLLPNRSASTSNYRYGFQNQEKDDEIKGEGLSYNYKYRMHDPRVGRFFNIDPAAKQFPWNSPYAFAENKIIQFVELEGLEIAPPMPRMAPRIGLPRIGLPRISLPKAPIRPTYPIPPVAIPEVHTPPMPQAPTFPDMPLHKSEATDWGDVDLGDTSTWPEAPPLEGQGELQEIDPPEGTKGWQKAREKGHKRWIDEKGRIYRPHKPDKHHPKGHWDVKEAGNNTPWKNYTPDGTEIPKGKVWGSNWELPMIMGPKLPNNLSEEEWNKYQEVLKNDKEYQKKLKNYRNLMKEYNEKMKDYREKLKEYEKKMDEYYENCGCPRYS